MSGMQGFLSSVKVSVGAATVFDMGQLFVELVDHTYATEVPATWVGLMQTLERRLKEIGAFDRIVEAREFIGKWKLFFNAIPAGEGVSEAKRLEIRREATSLSERLKAWLADRSRK
jgi:hypothetical protein